MSETDFQLVQQNKPLLSPCPKHIHTNKAKCYPKKSDGTHCALLSTFLNVLIDFRNIWRNISFLISPHYIMPLQDLVSRSVRGGSIPATCLEFLVRLLEIKATSRDHVPLSLDLMFPGLAFLRPI